MPRFTQAGQVIVNDVSLSEDVELAASGIVFTNTELGRVLGRFTFSAGGSTLINQRGGYIGAPAGVSPFSFMAVVGSDGNDRVVDSGNIQGLISLGGGDDVLISSSLVSTYAGSIFGADLGEGNDLLRIEGSSAPSFVSGTGGAGIDTFEYAVDGGQINGSGLTGFEILSLRSGSSFTNFSGFTQVIIAPPQANTFINFVDSDNPAADLTIPGAFLSLQFSDFRSVTGSDANEFLSINGSTFIAQGIAMGGGTDNLLLGSGALASNVAPMIDGGAGSQDSFGYFVGQSPITDSLANVTGFEILRLVNGFLGAGQTVTLSNISGFTNVWSEFAANLVIASGNLSQTAVAGTLGGSVTIASGVSVAEYRYAFGIGFQLDTTLTQSNIQNSTILNNNGTVLGGVVFFDGDDHYNGLGGSAAFVNGNAGNDLLEGGAMADDLRGDAGGDTLRGNGGNDRLSGGLGRDQLFGGEGNDTLDGGDDADRLTGGIGDDTLGGGSNIDTAVVSGLSSSYTITQTSTGVFQVVGADGTDTLTAIEFLQFDDQILRLRPGTGVSVNFNTADPSVYQSALNNIRDFDGNALGGNGSWLRIGSADVNGDGDIDQIIVNRALGRFATVGTAPDGLVYFSDHGWAGETRVAGIYIDPFVANGTVAPGSPNDSQRRFQNDLQIENINRVLGANDYDRDGGQEVFFALTDGTAYLRAVMHADGNIRFADYRSQQQVIDYLTANGFGPETYAGWFPTPSSGEGSLDAAQDISTASAARLPEAADITAMPGTAGGELLFNPLGLAHSPIMNEYLVPEFY